MKTDICKGPLKGISLTILGALLLQGASAVWWVSAHVSENAFLERRVTGLEETAAKTAASVGAVHERLARIEERLDAQIVLLNRIEKQTGR